MKNTVLFCLLFILYGKGELIAQTNVVLKYQPKYLREDNRNFKALTKTATPDGWIEFKAEAKLQAENFFNLQGNAIGL